MSSTNFNFDPGEFKSTLKEVQSKTLTTSEQASRSAENLNTIVNNSAHSPVIDIQLTKVIEAMNSKKPESERANPEIRLSQIKTQVNNVAELCKLNKFEDAAAKRREIEGGEMGMLIDAYNKHVAKGGKLNDSLSKLKEGNQDLAEKVSVAFNDPTNAVKATPAQPTPLESFGARTQAAALSVKAEKENVCKQKAACL